MDSSTVDTLITIGTVVLSHFVAHLKQRPMLKSVQTIATLTNGVHDALVNEVKRLHEEVVDLRLAAARLNGVDEIAAANEAAVVKTIRSLPCMRAGDAPHEGS